MLWSFNPKNIEKGFQINMVRFYVNINHTYTCYNISTVRDIGDEFVDGVIKISQRMTYDQPILGARWKLYSWGNVKTLCCGIPRNSILAQPRNLATTEFLLINDPSKIEWWSCTYGNTRCLDRTFVMNFNCCFTGYYVTIHR